MCRRQRLEATTIRDDRLDKTAKLALGFDGGIEALAEMAMKYNVDMASAYELTVGCCRA